MSASARKGSPKRRARPEVGRQPAEPPQRRVAPPREPAKADLLNMEGFGEAVRGTAADAAETRQAHECLLREPGKAPGDGVDLARKLRPGQRHEDVRVG